MKTIGNVQQDAQIRAVASGTLANGDTVIVNSDGTVSAVAISSASSGTAVMFDDHDGSMGISYDSANGKVVVAYADPVDVGRGKAVVGTVSGTSITFGSPATFNSSTTYGVQIAYDANAGKHVIIYMDSGNSYYGTSIVATVSGTSISYGSAVVFESGYTTEYSIAYNPTAQKVVLFYRNTNQTNDGTLRVGTVSGTSISYGTVNRFEDGAENPSICYDSANDKMVIAYRDGTNGGDSGVARVATVSGTSISVGSEVTYESGDSFRGQIAYDETSGKVVIAYAEETNSNYGTAIAGSVSGTSITFGTKAVFNAEDTSYLGITYDAKAGKTIIAFKDGSNGTSAVPVELSGTTISFGTTTAVDTGTVSYRQRIVYDATSESNVIILQKNNDGYAVVYQAPSTNLTSDNFIGFADSGYVNGQNVGVDSTCSIGTVPATGYAFSIASYDSKSFSVTSQDTEPNGLAFNNTGTKMYMAGETGDRVYQYTLSTAFDVSTASYDSVSFDVSSQETAPRTIVFNNDGTAMYIAGTSSDTAYQYTLTTAFDISTASYASKSLALNSTGEGVPRGMSFNDDGSKLFVSGDMQANIVEYGLTTPFDLSTGSYTTGFSVSSQDSGPAGVTFNADGTKMFVSGYSTDTVYQYSLSTGFDVSTASYDSVSLDVSGQDSSPRDIRFSADGTKFYVMGNGSDTVYQYSTAIDLTAGQKYYVQTDGSLSETAGAPSVLAGTAISATEILVKG